MSPSGVQHQIQRLVDWMASQQPDNPAVEMLQRQLPTLFAHGTLVALGLILLGSVKLAGAPASSPGGRGATGCSSPASSRCCRSTCARPPPTARRSRGSSSALDLAILAALLWFRGVLAGRPVALAAAGDSGTGAHPSA